MVPVISLQNKWVKRGAIVFGVALVGVLLWWVLAPRELAGFASSNGRIEATEVDISPKIAGRIEQELVDEGDYVHKGEVVAKMDIKSLEAQRAEYVAQFSQAMAEIATARSIVAQRESEKAATVATLSERRAELHLAKQTLARSRVLSREGAVAVQNFDDDVASMNKSIAAVTAAQAQVVAADAAIASARSEVNDAVAHAAAAKASIARVQSDIDDSILRSPRDGRVQYRVAQPGEVLAAGGKVLNLIDLTDVYMTFFLPTEYAGRIRLGAEARIVLDAMPNIALPARITFVSDVAQFTPKTVETEEERQKLTFRLKARIDASLLRKYIRIVKTGLPGITYVKLDPKAEWPARLSNVLR